MFGKVGRADSATDPAPFSMAEITVQLLPRAEWPVHPRARWYSSWAPAPIRRGRCRSSGRRASRPRPPSWRPARRGEPAPRLDGRLDRTGAHASGHDVDRGAHAAGDPRVRARCRPLDALAARVRSLVAPLPGTKTPSPRRWAARPASSWYWIAEALARHACGPSATAEVADVFLAGGPAGRRGPRRPAQAPAHRGGLNRAACGGADRRLDGAQRGRAVPAGAARPCSARRGSCERPR